MLTSVLLDERNIPQPAFGTLLPCVIGQLSYCRVLIDVTPTSLENQHRSLLVGTLFYSPAFSTKENLAHGRTPSIAKTNPAVPVTNGIVIQEIPIHLICWSDGTTFEAERIEKRIPDPKPISNALPNKKPNP